MEIKFATSAAHLAPDIDEDISDDLRCRLHVGFVGVRVLAAFT
jgi:hypothetical protein